MKQKIEQCQSCNKEFIIESQDFDFYNRIKVPEPTFCWLCRAQRRFAFRNERNLYKRKSDFTDKDIFSMYSTTSPVKVYERDVWLSDKWDPMDYGRDYDWNEPFFQQIKELLYDVPLKNLNLVGGVNSEFSNNATEPKNCYLVVNASHPEDCYFGNGINYSKDCFDVSHISKCELCHEVFWMNECSNSMFSSHCKGSYNLKFCKDCNNCNDCFGCVGLRNKSYHIFNKLYSKEEYMEEIKKYNLGSYKELEETKKKAYAFWLKFPNKAVEGTHNTNVSGNYIDNSKNVLDSFLIREGEDLRYCQYAQELPGTKDCYDYSIWGDSNELLYESCSCGIQTNNLKFCSYVQEGVHDIEYSMLCSASSNLFGCVGLKSKEYCIFNKQYTKEEYNELVPKIKKHMDDMPYTDKKGRVYKYGEFFPIEISPLAYNETLAQEHFPLTKEQALEQGYTWKDIEDRDIKPTIAELPDDIKHVKDSIVEDIIKCIHDGKCNHNCPSAFRITKRELNFYKKAGLPIPRLCPSCRHHIRLEQRTSLKIYDRKCAKCKKNIQTSYSSDRPEIVYCEDCYNKEVN